MKAKLVFFICSIFFFVGTLQATEKTAPEVISGYSITIANELSSTTVKVSRQFYFTCLNSQLEIKRLPRQIILTPNVLAICLNAQELSENFSLVSALMENLDKLHQDELMLVQENFAAIETCLLAAQSRILKKEIERRVDANHYVAAFYAHTMVDLMVAGDVTKTVAKDLVKDVPGTVATDTVEAASKHSARNAAGTVAWLVAPPAAKRSPSEAPPRWTAAWAAAQDITKRKLHLINQKLTLLPRALGSLNYTLASLITLHWTLSTAAQNFRTAASDEIRSGIPGEVNHERVKKLIASATWEQPEMETNPYVVQLRELFGPQELAAISE